jgi:hypothetical protein
MYVRWQTGVEQTKSEMAQSNGPPPVENND